MAFRGGIAKFCQATMAGIEKVLQTMSFLILHSLRQFDRILLSQAANIHEYNYHNAMSRSLWSSAESCYQVSGAGPQAVP